MNDERTYPAGVPCWVDTDQPDVDAARHFYAGLFGWAFADAVPPDVPGTYLIASLDGADVAAIGPAEGSASWNTYIAVDDADVVAASVRDAGGTLAARACRRRSRRPARGLRRPARCTLPAVAAACGGWARRLSTCPVAGISATCTPPDPAAAQSFYGPLFGWEFDEVGFGTMIRRPGYGDHLAATVDPGIRDRQDGISAPPGFADAIGWLVPHADGRDHWHVTFTVADRDDSVAIAEKLGATVISSEDTDWTKSAVIRDPQGAELTLSQFTPPER